jgi:hypothetical protein
MISLPTVRQQQLTETMIIVRKESHGAVYTIDPDSKELYYAPIYTDNSINLSEFAPVDLSDSDEEEMLLIQQELIALNK